MLHKLILIVPKMLATRVEILLANPVTLFCRFCKHRNYSKIVYLLLDIAVNIYKLDNIVRKMEHFYVYKFDNIKLPD